MTNNPIHALLISRSIEVIKDGQAATGAYLASPTFPTYQYSWFRDGAFIADAMSRVGEIASAEAFFGWCDRILTDRREQILDLVARGERDVEDVALTEHLHTRYTIDGQESGTEWQDFQLDGYGTWLWALDRHSIRHGRDRTAFAEGAALTVRYLCVFWASPFYDWWEENGHRRHPSSLAPIRRGLLAASGWEELDPGLRKRAAIVAGEIAALIAAEGLHDGHLTKYFGSDQVDASLIACMTPFELYPMGDPVATATIERIERELAPAGVYRFLDDTYYGGGEWILLAGFLGWHHAKAGNLERAQELADWIAAQADVTLNLPEQVDTHALHPERIAEWVERWGPSASPLLWSHAMYLTLATSLGMTGVTER
ncbi:GH15 family glucan-1,4-alpha-glucosidase [Cryobacterium mesophilum]|uniref:Glycoside hydrolase family 15 n=1 Tax=Terrimesophilobacter mesophilus TaxID=433647 RepID=A0A4R8VBG1_9MICO|nr:glycoside hydrolase family 15 protein [Terrimesophilobacter mesophilus]MBB5632335.1 GH15 family glucan-1,4-alpha-glucosidase [Terrimesophilobacter mesophilus]TFB79177.1 glycoside hydrolase family 15 [Terrimesophilobacter mesophilus]